MDMSKNAETENSNEHLEKSLESLRETLQRNQNDKIAIVLTIRPDKTVGVISFFDDKALDYYDAALRVMDAGYENVANQLEKHIEHISQN